jgi:hypothetical protein
MHHRRTALRAVILVVVAAIAAIAVAACGSSASGGSGGDPNALLTQTFSGTHKVTSGNLDLTLTIDPSGSSTLSGPITISFGGPFQTRGAGKLPASNFTISGSALGQSVSLGILSTGTAGYVTLSGTSYQMPAATFQKLESSFAQLAATPGASSQASGAFSKLGIQPLHWLSHPTIVGTENVGGAQTTHIRAGVNVQALLSDLNTVLERASTIGVSGAGALKSGLSPTARQKIAAAIRNPTLDVWTGTSDKTVRKLTIGLTVLISGSLSSQLGGVRSADVGLTLVYANLNQPQTIIAPTNVRPFSEFQSKVRTFIQSLQGAASGLLGGSSSSSGGASGGSSSGSSGNSSSVQKYSQCIQASGGDVAKMQKCASLLGSGGG